MALILIVYKLFNNKIQLFAFILPETMGNSDSSNNSDS